MMKRMLPSGDDETFVEEVFLAYMQNIGRMSELLRRSKELQRIIDLMGKLDVEYGAKQERAKQLRHLGAYDLGLSKDVRHVLPVELLKLKVPILRVLFFSQMLEGELLTYQLRGLDWSDAPDNKKKGPVIALIDASGSMSGEPELLAKAFILMLAKRMEREGRDIKVILFAAADWKLEIKPGGQEEGRPEPARHDLPALRRVYRLQLGAAGRAGHRQGQAVARSGRPVLHRRRVAGLRRGPGPRLERVQAAHQVEDLHAHRELGQGRRPGAGLRSPVDAAHRDVERRGQPVQHHQAHRRGRKAGVSAIGRGRTSVYVSLR